MFKKIVFLALIALSLAAKKPKFQSWLICGNNFDFKVDSPLMGI